MYNITVTNNFGSAIRVNVGAGYSLVTGETKAFPYNLGDGSIDVPGVGHLLLHDVGDRQIGGFSKATWGVYLSYQGEELVFRYEGGGQLKITFNDFGQAQLECNGAISKIDLGAFILPGQ
jgi:hypothetical protein